MRTQTGYIIPVILIIILLTLTGFVTFGIKTTSKEPVPTSQPKTSEPIPVPSQMPIQDSPDVEEMIVSTTTLETDIGGEEIVQ